MIILKYKQALQVCQEAEQQHFILLLAGKQLSAPLGYIIDFVLKIHVNLLKLDLLKPGKNLHHRSARWKIVLPIGSYIAKYKINC
ncbi:MAG: hypothetical protein FWF38_00100 [Spirochaetaceae bacterium]|nr:hypothetical protein [Spirochaetaceae bacterium]